MDNAIVGQGIGANDVGSTDDHIATVVRFDPDGLAVKSGNVVPSSVNMTRRDDFGLGQNGFQIVHTVLTAVVVRIEDFERIIHWRKDGETKRRVHRLGEAGTLEKGDQTGKFKRFLNRGRQESNAVIEKEGRQDTVDNVNDPILRHDVGNNDACLVVAKICRTKTDRVVSDRYEHRLPRSIQGLRE